jgi:hypothetical protein
MIQYHENMRSNQTIMMLNQRHVDKLLEDKFNSSKEIEKLKIDISCLQNRLSMIKETAMGLRFRSKEMKPISFLEKRGGAFIKIVFGLKTILDPTCIDFLDLCKTMLKKCDIKAMLKDPKFDDLRKEVVNQLIASLKIDVKDVQGVCDHRWINRKAYAYLFKVLRERPLNGGIKKILVPFPFHVKKEHALRSTQIIDSLGDAYQLEALHEVASKSKKKVSSEIISLIKNKKKTRGMI